MVSLTVTATGRGSNAGFFGRVMYMRDNKILLKSAAMLAENITNVITRYVTGRIKKMKQRLEEYLMKEIEKGNIQQFHEEAAARAGFIAGAIAALRLLRKTRRAKRGSLRAAVA